MKYAPKNQKKGTGIWEYSNPTSEARDKVVSQKPGFLNNGIVEETGFREISFIPTDCYKNDPLPNSKKNILKVAANC